MNTLFTSLSDFLWMGGYAYYIWPAYGITLLVLGINIWAARNQYRTIQQKLKQLRQSNAPRS